MLRYIIIIFIIISSKEIIAQQLSPFSLYNSNPHALNPAFIRMDHEDYGLLFGSLGRSQWATPTGSFQGIRPRTLAIYGNYTSITPTDLLGKNLLVMGGGYFLLDEVGPTKYTNGFISGGLYYGGTNQAKKEWFTVAAGLKAGVQSLTTDLDEMLLLDRRDPFANEIAQSTNAVDIIAGYYIELNKRNEDKLVLYLGGAIHQVLGNSSTYNISNFLPQEAEGTDRRYNSRHWYGQLGGRLWSGKSTKAALEPYVWFKYSTENQDPDNKVDLKPFRNNNSPFNWDLNLKIISKEIKFNRDYMKLWLNLGNNNAGISHVQAGVQLETDIAAFNDASMLELGVSWDYNYAEINNVSLGHTFEVMLNCYIDK